MFLSPTGFQLGTYDELINSNSSFKEFIDLEIKSQSQSENVTDLLQNQNQNDNQNDNQILSLNSDLVASSEKVYLS